MGLPVGNTRRLARLWIQAARNVTAPWTMLDDHGLLDPEKAVTLALHSAFDELTWWTDVSREARATREMPA